MSHRFLWVNWRPPFLLRLSASYHTMDNFNMFELYFVIVIPTLQWVSAVTLKLKWLNHCKQSKCSSNHSKLQYFIFLLYMRKTIHCLYCICLFSVYMFMTVYFTCKYFVEQCAIDNFCRWITVFSYKCFVSLIDWMIVFSWASRRLSPIWCAVREQRVTHGTQGYTLAHIQSDASGSDSQVSQQETQCFLP